MTFEQWLDEYYPPSERPEEENYLIKAMRVAWAAGYSVGWNACMDEMADD